eukprot:XP_001695480.1 origin recognition complex subunit 6 [Chlamydomonas reinhardtii]
MFTRIQRLLDVRPALDLRELVTIFGYAQMGDARKNSCLQLRPAVEQLLRAYKSRFLTSLPAEERARADLTRPAFLAGAFLLAAKKHKAKVDRAALTNKMGLTRGELEGALKDMAARCADMLQPQQAAEGDEGAGRKRARGDTAGEEQAADGPAKALGAATGRGGANKRPRRGAAAGAEAEGEDGEAAVSVAAAHDVAVEDLRLVLCGIRPAAAPAAAAASQDEREEAEAERPKSRKKLKKVEKGSRTEGKGDRNEGAALGNGEEEAAVVVMAVAKKGKLKKSRRLQAEEQVPEQGREGHGQELVAGAV